MKEEYDFARPTLEDELALLLLEVPWELEEAANNFAPHWVLYLAPPLLLPRPRRSLPPLPRPRAAGAGPWSAASGAGKGPCSLSFGMLASSTAGSGTSSCLVSVMMLHPGCELVAMSHPCLQQRDSGRR